MIDVLVSGILALIMFGIGLSLQAAHFLRLRSAPGVLFLGLFLQLVFLPALAFGVSHLLRLPTNFAAGVVILAACPGGLTSNFISYLLRANSALAVSLTICNTFLSLLTIPFYTNLALGYFGSADGLATLPFWPTAGQIFLVVLVPVAAGFFFRARAQVRAKVLQQKLRWVSVVLLALLFTIKLFAPPEAGGSNITLDEILIILPASLLINVTALLSGRLAGLLFRLRRDDQLTLGVEVGIQNTSLAFLVTLTLLGNEQMVKPALVYAMFTFFTAFGYGLLLKPGMWNTLRREVGRLHDRG